MLYNNVQLFSDAQALVRQVLGEAQRHRNDEAMQSAISVLGSINTKWNNLEKPGLPEAATLLENVIEFERRTRGADNPTTQLAIVTLASLYRLHRPPRNAEAEALLEEMRRSNGEPRRVLEVFVLEPQPDREAESTRALRSTIEQLPEIDPDRIAALRQLAELYVRMNRYLEAEKVFDDLIAAQSKAFGQTHPNTIQSFSALGALHTQEFRFQRSRGEWDQARQAAEKAEEFYTRFLAVSRTVPGAQSSQGTRLYLAALATTKALLGRYAEAESLFKEIVALQETARNVQQFAKLASVAAIGWLQFQQNRLSEAESSLQEAVAGYQQTQLDTWERYNADSILGAILTAQGKYAEAEPYLVRGFEATLRGAPIPGPHFGSPIFMEEREPGERILKLYQDWGKPEKVAEWRQKVQGAPTFRR
jgi:tetratricopeptide (TPR) repeat protein